LGFEHKPIFPFSPFNTPSYSKRGVLIFCFFSYFLPIDTLQSFPTLFSCLLFFTSSSFQLAFVVVFNLVCPQESVSRVGATVTAFLQHNFSNRLAHLLEFLAFSSVVSFGVAGWLAATGPVGPPVHGP
jgi:hypothetical protein